MGFIEWIASRIARAVADKVMAHLKEEYETSQKLNAISGEAKELVTELDNAQSDVERKAILRKIAFFANVSNRLL